MTKFLCLVIFIITTISQNSFAIDKVKITWLEIDYPPYYMNTPEYGLGIHNKISRYISNELKDRYEFDYINANTTRLETFFITTNEKRIFCVPGGPIKEGLNAAISKNALFKVPSIGLVVRKNDPRVKESKTSYSIYDFMDKKNSIGFVEYGNFPPKILEIHKNKPQFFYNINTTKPLPPIEMLVKNRIGAYIIYKLPYEYLLMTEGKGYQDQIQFINIKEAGPHLNTFIYCGVSKNSSEFVTVLDNIIISKKFRNYLKEVLLEYRIQNF